MDLLAASEEPHNKIGDRKKTDYDSLTQLRTDRVSGRWNRTFGIETQSTMNRCCASLLETAHRLASQ